MKRAQAYGLWSFSRTMRQSDILAPVSWEIAE